MTILTTGAVGACSAQPGRETSSMAVNGQAGAEIDAGTIGAKFSGLSTLHKLRNQMELTARAGKLSGKVAVATGGSSGLGEAIATRRTDEDPTVADIDKAGAERVACTSKRASFHACDVTNEDEVPRATFDVVAAEHGRVNVLINNSGVASRRLSTSREWT